MLARATQAFTAQYGHQVHTVAEGDVLDEPLSSYFAETGAPVEPAEDSEPPKKTSRTRKTTT